MPTDSSSPLLVSVLVSPWSRRRSVRRCIPSRVRAPPLVLRVHRIDRAAWTHPSNHPLCSPSVRIPSPAPLAGTSSDSIVLLGASPRPSRAPRVDVPATSSRPRTTFSPHRPRARDDSFPCASPPHRATHSSDASSIHPCIHEFMHAFMHSFMHSFMHAFIHSCIHSFTDSWIH